MVEYIDAVMGRDVVKQLLAMTSNQEMLALLDTDEATFIAD